MRIAHLMSGRLNPSSANGVDKMVVGLAGQLVARGHEVRVFGISKKDPVDTEPVESVTLNDLPWGVAREISAFRPDIVHVHSVFVPALDIIELGLHRSGIPYCVTPHGALSPAVMSANRLRKAAYLELVALPTLNRACFVHALTAAEAERAETLGVRTTIATVGNGIDPPPRADDLPGVAELVPQLGDSPFILFLGRLEPDQKGLDVLLSAFRDNEAAMVPLRLVLVGAAHPSWRRVVERFSDLIASGRVVVLPPLLGPERFSLLHACSGFIHPSRWEGMAFSVLEAASCGRPLILSEAADPGGVFARAGSAIVCAPDEVGVADALIRFSEADSSSLARMGASASRTCRDRFGWRSVCDAIESAYEACNG